MAEKLPSSFKFNDIETVDTVFSKLLVANLFKDQTFKAGVTFTDKYDERAGQIYIRKLGKTAATIKDATASGGLDMEDTETADKLLLIQKKDAISRSEKCYNFVEKLRASGKSVDKVSEVLEEFKESCQIQYMKYLLQEPAKENDVVVGGAKRSANTTACKTFEEFTNAVLAERKEIRTYGGVADVLLISPEMETLCLANASKSANAFIPETNEDWLKNGKVGRLYGLNVFSTNLLGGNNKGTAKHTEFIIYDHNAFGIACDIEGIRLENAKKFFGCYAQVAGVFGGGICNPDLAIAKVVIEYVKCEDLTAFAEGVTYYTKNSKGEYVAVPEGETFSSSKTYYTCD